MAIMNKFYLKLLVLCSVLLGCDNAKNVSTPSSRISPATITPSRNVYGLDHIDFTLPLVNRMDQTINVVKVESDCSCVSRDFTGLKLLPKEEGGVPVRVMINGRSGKINVKTILSFVSDGDQRFSEVQNITLWSVPSGEILAPKVINMGVSRGEGLEAYAELDGTSKAFGDVSVRSDPGIGAESKDVVDSIALDGQVVRREKWLFKVDKAIAGARNAADVVFEGLGDSKSSTIELRWANEYSSHISPRKLFLGILNRGASIERTLFVAWPGKIDFVHGENVTIKEGETSNNWLVRVENRMETEGVFEDRVSVLDQKSGNPVGVISIVYIGGQK